MSKLKAILFDMDGTLADTEDVHRIAFNEAFNELGYNWHWTVDEYIELLQISGGRERIRHFIQIKEDLNFDDALAKAKLIHKRKSQIYREKLVNDHIKLRVGIERLINEARKEKIKLAIVTSSSRKNVKTLLNNTLGKKSLKWFESIITCEIIIAQKPSPVAYEMVLNELGVKPANAIAFEDTRNGNLSAIAAGVKTIITTHNLTIDDDFHGASLVLSQLGEPDSPFIVMQGNVNDASFVDVGLIRDVLRGKAGR